MKLVKMQAIHTKYLQCKLATLVALIKTFFIAEKEEKTLIEASVIYHTGPEPAQEVTCNNF